MAKKSKPTKLYKWFRTLRRLHKVFLRPLYPYKRLGHTEKLNDRSYIIVGNHRSVLDVIPAVLATDKPINFMAKKELFEKGFFKWLTKKCECIPVSRDGTDVRALMQAMKILKDGGIVGLFPEGTRNKTEELFLPFKSGAAALAIKTKTPIIPMLQLSKIKMFKRSYIFYGEPFELTEFYDKKLTQEDIENADNQLRQRMTDIYFELQDIVENKKYKKK